MSQRERTSDDEAASPGGAVEFVDPEISTASRSVLGAIHRYEASDLHLRRRLAARLGINASDLLALRHIRRHQVDGEPVRVSDLQRWLTIYNASASVVTRRLIDAGLLEKSPGPTDRRERVLLLTEEGRVRLDDAVGDAPQALDALLDTMTTAESQRIVELLGEVALVLDRTAVPEVDAYQG